MIKFIVTFDNVAARKAGLTDIQYYIEDFQIVWQLISMFENASIHVCIVVIDIHSLLFIYIN